MRGHQKYFALEAATGELAPHFLAVINLTAIEGLGAGGARTRAARAICGCAIFLGGRSEIRLGDYLPKLSQVTFESRLGSYGDKVERMRALARWLAEQWFAPELRWRCCRI